MFYRLLPKDKPVHPDKVWSGKVLYVEGRYLLVESLEVGYNGLREIITIDQIREVEDDRHSYYDTVLAKQKRYE